MTDRDSPAVLAALRDSLPGDRVVDDPGVLDAHRKDEAGFVDAGWPIALLRPTTTAEVCEILRIASRLRVPVVPRGAGSGLSGGANAIGGGLVLSLERMRAILDVADEDLTAVVQPGVVNAELTATVKERGLTYPPDPASAAFSTIGGNIATNAGGLCCVKYGVTRDFVLGLEVVLADGSTMRTGRRTVKGVAGYDLTALLVGSEGTLGVITEATVRLLPAPEQPCTLVAFFSTVSAASRAATAAIQAGVIPSMLELMDRVTIQAVDDWIRMGLDRSAGALLVAQSDSGGRRGNEEMKAFERCCADAGATYVASSTDPDEAEQLTQARRCAYPALERLGATLLDDVAVPLSRVPELVANVEAIAQRAGLVVGTFGHVGDGNMHPTIVYDRDDPAQAAAAYQAFRSIVDTALELGGTSTGEHGVGLLKRTLLGAELDPGALRIQRALKSVFDPLGILNPGKVLPADLSPGPGTRPSAAGSPSASEAPGPLRSVEARG